MSTEKSIPPGSPDSSVSSHANNSAKSAKCVRRAGKKSSSTGKFASASELATAGKPPKAGGFPTTGKPVRVPAQATSRPRPNMMRPGRATLDEQEPCPAYPPTGKTSRPQQKGSDNEEPASSPKPGGAKARSSRAARTSPKRASRKKRIRLADAFRSRGIDEYVIADGYAVALKTLKPKEGGETEASIGKTFMDTLKECSRILDPPRTSTERGASDAPAVVQLIHRVPRPARGRDGLPQG